MLEINREHWPVLRDLYIKDRINLTGYDLINNFMSLFDSAGNVKIYAADDNWRKHGSFMLIHRFDTKTDIYLNTLNGSLVNLQLLLNSLKLKDMHLFCGYEKGLKNLVELYWLEREPRNQETLEHQGTFVYHLPHSEIEPFDNGSISDITFGPLLKKHAVIVDEYWAYRSNDSLPLIRNLIKYNISAGAFDKTGRLLAWCLRSTHGSLSHLYVLPSHRRLGLASLLVRFIAQEISKTGAEVLATIVFSNEKSRNLFEKLKFKHVDEIYWAMVPPS